MLKDFKEFIMRGNVLDMAVGVIIGAAFGKIVASLVSDIVRQELEEVNTEPPLPRQEVNAKESGERDAPEAERRLWGQLAQRRRPDARCLATLPHWRVLPSALGASRRPVCAGDGSHPQAQTPG